MLDTLPQAEDRTGLMEALTRVIGIGQPAAGDDGVGITVAEALRNTELPDNTQIVTLPDPAHLFEQLEGVEQVILIDAVIGDNEPGTVACLTLDDIEDGKANPISSHGMSIVQAVQMARALTPDTIAADIRVVGITINAPKRYTYEMSSEVANAIPKTVALVRQLAGT